jgi:DNA-directed RNA polymerase subunit RPC12/RpoP
VQSNALGNHPLQDGEMVQMSELRCPHCGSTPEETLPEKEVSDWYYNNNLYAPEEELEIKCLRCDEKFWVGTYQSIGYNCEKDREDL